MSRDIKFRAWNEMAECMVYDIQKSTNFSIILEDESQKVMQYTGLKDKNDKEIYEGDIVKAEFYCNGEMVTEISEIEWYKNKYESGFTIKNPLIEEWMEIEVVGNIYKNLSLLEQA